MSGPLINNPTQTSPLTSSNLPPPAAEEAKAKAPAAEPQHTASTSKINASYPAGAEVKPHSWVMATPRQSPASSPREIANPAKANELPVIAKEAGVKTDDQAVANNVKDKSSRDLFGAMDKASNEASRGIPKELREARQNALDSLVTASKLDTEKVKTGRALNEARAEIAALEKEISSFVANNKDKTGNTDALEAKYNALQTLLKSKKDEVGSLEQKNKKAEDLSKAAKATAEEAEAKYIELADVYDAQQPSSSTLILNAMRSDSDLAPPESTSGKLLSGLPEMPGNHSQSGELLNALNIKVDSADHEFEKASDEVKNLRTSLNDLKSSGKASEAEIHQAEEHLRNAEVRYENSMHVLNEAMEELSHEEGGIRAVNYNNPEIDELEAKEKESAANIQKMKNRLADLSEALDNAESDKTVKEFTAAVDRLREKIIEAEAYHHVNFAMPLLSAMLKEQNLANSQQIAMLNTLDSPAQAEEIRLVPIEGRFPVEEGNSKKSIFERAKAAGAPPSPEAQKGSIEPIEQNARPAGVSKLETVVAKPAQPKSQITEKRLNQALDLIGKIKPNEKLVFDADEKSFKIESKKPGFAFRTGTNGPTVEAVATIINGVNVDLISSDPDIKRAMSLIVYLKTDSTAQAVLAKNPELSKVFNKIVDSAKFSEYSNSLESLVDQITLAKDDKLVVMGDSLVVKSRDRSFLGRTGSKPASQEAITKLLERVTAEYDSVNEGNKNSKYGQLEKIKEFIDTNEWAQAAIKRGNHDLSKLEAAKSKADNVVAFTQKQLRGMTLETLENMSSITTVQRGNYTQEVSDVRRQAQVFKQKDLQSYLQGSLRSAQRFEALNSLLDEFNFLDNKNAVLRAILPSEKEFRSDFLSSGRRIMNADALAKELSEIYQGAVSESFKKSMADSPDIPPAEKKKYASMPSQENIISFCKEWVSNPDYYQKDIAKMDSLISVGLQSNDPTIKAGWEEVQAIRNSQQPKPATSVYKPVNDPAKQAADQTAFLNAIKNAKTPEAFNALVKSIASTILKEDLKAFKQIENYELNGTFELKPGETVEKAPHAIAINDRFNDMSSRVQDLILSSDNHDRQKVIEFFISVATELVQQKDFHGAFLITSALTTTSITNLSEMKNLKLTNKSAQAALEQLISYNNSESNYKALRKEAAKNEGYIIPMPVVSKDFFAITENKDRYVRDDKKDMRLLEIVQKPKADISAVNKMQVADLDAPLTELQEHARDILFADEIKVYVLEAKSDALKARHTQRMTTGIRQEK